MKCKVTIDNQAPNIHMCINQDSLPEAMRSRPNQAGPQTGIQSGPQTGSQSDPQSDPRSDPQSDPQSDLQSGPQTSQQTGQRTSLKGAVVVSTAVSENLSVPAEGGSKKTKIYNSSNKSPSRTEIKGDATMQQNELGKQGIEHYSDCDVLSGRGGGTNLHPGNRYFRNLILSHLEMYDIANKSEKPNVARTIVQNIRDKGGRFLRKEKDGLYHEIGDEAAREKTSQGLRHRTFENKQKPKRRKLAKERRMDVEASGKQFHTKYCSYLSMNFLT